jgi:hypothetical protein
VRLKALASGLLIFGILLLVGWPFIMGPRPTAPVRTGSAISQEGLRDHQIALAEYERTLHIYGARFGLYVIVLVLTFGGTAVVALLAMRDARRRYVEEKMGNLQRLIEGTFEDHRRKDSHDG